MITVEFLKYTYHIAFSLFPQFSLLTYKLVPGSSSVQVWVYSALPDQMSRTVCMKSFQSSIWFLWRIRMNLMINVFICHTIWYLTKIYQILSHHSISYIPSVHLSIFTILKCNNTWHLIRLNFKHMNSQ